MAAATAAAVDLFCPESRFNGHANGKISGRRPLDYPSSRGRAQWHSLPAKSVNPAIKRAPVAEPHIHIARGVCVCACARARAWNRCTHIYIHIHTGLSGVYSSRRVARARAPKLPHQFDFAPDVAAAAAFVWFPVMRGEWRVCAVCVCMCEDEEIRGLRLRDTYRLLWCTREGQAAGMFAQCGGMKRGSL